MRIFHTGIPNSLRKYRYREFVRHLYILRGFQCQIGYSESAVRYSVNTYAGFVRQKTASGIQIDGFNAERIVQFYIRRIILLSLLILIRAGKHRVPGY
mgnify:FL=1